MKSPQPRRSSPVTLVFDVVVMIATPLVVTTYVASLFADGGIRIDLGGLIVVGAFCAWFADVEHRRGWIRKARASGRAD